MRGHFVTLGPAIDVVPLGDFSKHRVSHDEYAFLWRVMVGPHVEANTRIVTESWKLFCNLYLEGLQIGYAMGREAAKKEEQGYYGA